VTRLVALTQRVDDNETYEERRDCLDQRWAVFLQRINVFPLPLSNLLTEPRRLLDELPLNGLILTGGNDMSGIPGARSSAPERDHLEARLLDVAAEIGLPVLGVCRGLQMINVYLGGRLRQVEDHVATRHRLTLVSDSAIHFPDEVNSFHDMGMFDADLAEGLRVLARAPNGIVEAAAHRSLPWVGIMWHPEREKEPVAEDLDLFSSHLSGRIRQ